jgi:hypothetical protein
MGYANSRNPLTDIKGVGKVFGGTFPAQTWQAYMSKVLENAPPDDFPPPLPLIPPPPSSTAPLFTGPPDTAILVPYEPPTLPPTIPQITVPPLSIPPYPQPTTRLPYTLPPAYPTAPNTTAPFPFAHGPP